MKPKQYDEVRSRIDDYLKGYLSSRIGVVDTLVGIERNGHVVLQDFLRMNPKLNKFNVTSDNQLSRELVTDMSVVLFDDTIHSGRTMVDRVKRVLAQGPKDIGVSALLAAPEGIEKIQSTHPGVSIDTCRSIIDIDGLPSLERLTWQFTYRDGLTNNDNPDHHSLRITLDTNDIPRVANAVKDTIRTEFPLESSFPVESIAVNRGISRLSFHLDADRLVLSAPFDEVTAMEWPKIRCTLATKDGRCELIVMAIVNAFFDSSRCEIWRTHPDSCLANLAGKPKDDEICGICLPIRAGRQFLKDNQARIIDGLSERGIAAESVELRRPSLGRFLRFG